MKNRKITLAITVGILCVFGIISSSTYALWQITKTQKTPNDIVAACLDITMQNETGTFGLDKAWPISEEEGLNLTGYTFEIVNNCDDNVNYIIGLNSINLNSDNYLDNSSLRLKLDDKESSLISDFLNTEYADPDNKEIIRESKMIGMASLNGNSIATHNVKIWIDENAPVTEQGKLFRGQIFITGGQGVPIYNECYTMANNGTILSYDASCGLEVKVPETINGVDVKEVNFISFSQAEVIELSGTNLETKKSVKFLYYKDRTNKEKIENYYKSQKCPDEIDNCNLNDYYTIINNYKEYLTYDWDNYEIYSPNHYKYDESTNNLVTAPFDITSLDLSDTKYLTTINDYAFSQSLSGKLNNLELPENGSLTYIGNRAFAFNKQLKKVDFPNTLKTIGKAAFMTTALQNVYIPASVMSIEAYALSNNGTKSVEFEDTESNPSRLEYIGQYAFQLNSLDTIVFPSSLKFIDDFAFMTSYLNEVYIPASVETIGSYSFKDNYTISKLVFEDTEEKPSHLTKIEYQAFENNNLTSVKLPKSLEILENSVFSRNKITVGVIPENIKNIGGFIFYNNQELEKIIVKKENFNGVKLGTAWNAKVHLGSGEYTYAPYEFDPSYAE